LSDREPFAPVESEEEGGIGMMGVEGGEGLLSGFEALQIPLHMEQSLQNHHNTALYCKVCGKPCRHMGHLNAHMQMHMKEKPFLCGLCGKSFSSSGRLKGHQRIHTGEKPYQCHICRKRFNQTAHLTVHLRVHTGCCQQTTLVSYPLNCLNYVMFYLKMKNHS
uniref:C2H2-type domain-containing protein n=1 Tax=Hucho hucho TaxID=62062 RepID=A0A4W5Q6R4_9TELE